MSKPTSIAVLNHKGGVGKTATVSGLISGIQNHLPRAKILVVDADEQANIKTIFGIKLSDADGSLASILIDNAQPEKVAINVRNGIDVILSGGRKLRDFMNKFSNIPEAELLMRKRFEGLRNYDFVLIDSPPALSLISSNIALYADFILIPVAPDLLSVVAAKATITFLDSLEAHYNQVAKILGVVPTMHDTRRNLDLDILDDIERLAESGFLKNGICFNEVRNDIKFKTSQVRRKLINESFPKSNVAKDYTKLAQDVLKRIEEIKLYPKKNKTRSSEVQGTI
jgi:chromosome partitioning protein